MSATVTELYDKKRPKIYPNPSSMSSRSTLPDAVEPLVH